MPRKKDMGRNANGLGNIRKKTVTKNGKQYTYWEARCTVGYDPGTGKQIQKSISGKTQKEVAQKLKEMALQVDQGSYKAPSRMTLKDWLEIWQKDYLSDVKESTAYLYGRNIALYIIPHLGAVKLDKLTTHQIQSMYNDLLHPEEEGVNPLSPKTVRNIHGVLHKALGQAVEDKHLRFNLSEACKLPKVEEREMPTFEDNQVLDFLKAIEGHPYEYLYKVALFTGIRRGELLGVTWDCVDLEKGTLFVKKQIQKKRQKGGKYYFDSTKNSKDRTLVLAPSIVELFRLQKNKQDAMRAKAGDKWVEHNMVFTRDNGFYFSPSTAYNAFKRVVTKMGAPDIRFHALRHPNVKPKTQIFSITKIPDYHDKTIQDFCFVFLLLIKLLIHYVPLINV